MKTNILSIALSLLTVVAIAQKKEIRDAGKAVDKGSYAEAKTLLNQAEPLLSEANDNYKEDYYLYKGKAYLGTGENKSVEDLITAAEAFKKAQEMGSEEAAEGLATVTNSLVQGAINDQNNQAFEDGAKKLEASYELAKDTIHLYYAANFYTQAKKYDEAIEAYEKLKEMGFTGEGTEYYATNKSTGEEELMSKAQRDLMVKTGEYINPEDRKIPSKTGEIAEVMASIYLTQGEKDKALSLLQEAKAAYPDNMELWKAEADIYSSLGNKEKYKETINAILEKEPNNANLYLGLGSTALEAGQSEESIKYNKKALEIDPTLTIAKINIAAAILRKDSDIMEKMNNLGTSSADNKKYEELVEERKIIYREALPYLEDVIKEDPENQNVLQTTMNIYYQLGEEEKAEAIQAKLGENE